VNGCTRLSDRMVEVAHGRAEWAAAESKHLEQCADCAAEWRVVRATAGLGGAIEVDGARIADGVVARLRAAPPAPIASRRRWLARVAALAAAAVLAVTVWRAVPRAGPEPTPNFASELDGLDSDELAVVLKAYPEPLGAVMPDGAVGMSDLDSEELQAVLNSFEG